MADRTNPQAVGEDGFRGWRALPPTGTGTLIGLRLQPGPLARVDRWAVSQKDDPSRPEAIRRLVELGLASAQPAGARTKKPTKKAAEMASQEIDRLGDPLATNEERQLRKQRLIIPHNGREFEYRIKSANEEHERAVRRSELTKA